MGSVKFLIPLVFGFLTGCVAFDSRWENEKTGDYPFKCLEGQRYPDRDSCKAYFLCEGGRLKRKLCPALQSFDKFETFKCNYGVVCSPVKIPPSETRAHPQSCSSFEIYQENEWVVQECRQGYHYNPFTRACEDGVCKQCSHGQLVRGTTRSRYQECERGLWTEKECPQFKSFDPTKNQCVWSFENVSSKNSLLNNLADETCKDGETQGNIDCTTYSICSGGKWVSATCPENYLFDFVLSQCMPAEDARCLSCPGVHASEESCSAYNECHKGERVTKTCGFLKQWDGVTKKCVFWGANCFPGSKCHEEGKKIPTGDCKFYDECISGSYYRKACGFSRVFDAESSQCVWDYPWAECKARSCKEGETKPLDCTDYAKCVDGEWTKLQCDSDQTFTKGECVKGQCLVQKTSCRSYRINGMDFECVQGEIFDETTNKCVTGSCRAVRATPECTQNEIQPVPENCQEYKVCVDGRLVQKSCPDCMNFDPVEKVCKSVYSYPCARPIRTTQKPSTTEQPTTAKPSTTAQPSTTEQPITTAKPSTTLASTTEQPPTTIAPTSTPTPEPTTPNPGPTTPTAEPTTSTPAPACAEGEKKPNKENCKKFFVCKSGKFIEDSCNMWRKFDSVDRKCVNWGARCAS